MIELSDTGHLTSQLGFGCSSIMGSLNRRDSLQVLEWAFEEGIRHFDVAPLYGYGEAESCVGEFLARHPGEVTVATKFGIPPERRSKWKQLARNLARPVIKAMPGLKARAQKAAHAVDGPSQARDLSASAAMQSLEVSLRKLRVDKIDLFLLHDVTPEEVRRNESLLEMLRQSRAEQKIAAFGIGTERAFAERILQEAPAFAPVVQREWSVFDPLDRDSAFHISHRALSSNRLRLQSYLERSPVICAKWSTALNMDLHSPGELSAMMMRTALWANPRGIVLCSSKSKEHIRANADLASQDRESSRAEVFYCLVQQNLSSIPVHESPS